MSRSAAARNSLAALLALATAASGALPAAATAAPPVRPAQVPAASAAPPAAEAAPPVHELDLTELKRLARLHDPRVEQSLAQLDHARAQKDQADWTGFPEFATTVAVAPTPEARLREGDAGSLENVETGWSHPGATLRAELQAILPVYTFGKGEAGRGAAAHQVGAYSALADRARDQAAFDMAKAYWGWVTANGGLKSIDDTRAKVKEAQDKAKELLDEGSDQISRAEAAKLDYLAEEIEARYAETVKSAALAETGIRLLIGAAPDAPLALRRAQLPGVPASPQLEQALAVAREQRPELRAAKEAIAAREQLIALETARYYPDFALVGGANYAVTSNASSPVTPFANNPYNGLGGYVALAMRATFDFPIKNAKVHQAEADLREAQSQLRQAEALIRLELQQALGDLESARVRADRYQRQSAIGKRLLTQAAVAFDSGLGQGRELLEDTLLYFRAEGERFSALYDGQLAWAALLKAQGRSE